ncbi:MAG TPA: hypothetical protein V6D19_00140, partial [Stenomitos sp.]
SVIPCWTLDLNRMSSKQVVMLASIFAEVKQVTLEQAIAKLHREGACLSYRWVESLECGPEGRARSAEIREFFALCPDPSPGELLGFYALQKEKWVEGDARPAPELFVQSPLGRLQWTPPSGSINRL